MSEKSLKMLAGVVAGLLVLYLITALASGSPDASAADGGALAAALEKAGAGEPRSIRILSRQDTVELRRDGARWTVAGYPADSARVARFLEALRDARIGHLASSNAANHARLGVTDSAARVLEITGEDGESVRLLVGDAGPSYDGTFMRLPGRDEAYLVYGAIRTHVTRDVDDWRDRTIIAVDTAAIRTLELTREGATYALTRGDDGWTLDGAAADEDAVADVLRELVRLEATGFVADTTEEARDRKRFGALVALDADGDTLAALSLAERNASYLIATVPGDSTRFELPRWRADRILPTADALRADDADDGGGDRR
ncbi:MAG TPA: DUF4340 domain-containing protein [Longimicrobiales bacterium]